MSYAGPLYTFYIDYNDGLDHLGTLITHSPDVQAQIDPPLCGQVVIAVDPNIPDWRRYALIEETWKRDEDSPMWMRLKMLEEVPRVSSCSSNITEGSTLEAYWGPARTIGEDRP